MRGLRQQADGAVHDPDGYVLEVVKLENIEVGKTYRTHGGWKAVVIWKRVMYEEPQPNFIAPNINYYVIHKPNEGDERGPILHDEKGKAKKTFGFDVQEPPIYDPNFIHPADLEEEWKE